MEHTEGTFKNRHGYELFHQSWHAAGQPRAVVVVAHGLAEHSGRYQKLADYLAARNYAVYSYDQRGHGRSDGRRCYINKFTDYTDDLDDFIKLVRRDSVARLFILGHSMGGTIAASYVINRHPDMAGLILSSPLMKVGDSVSAKDIFLAKILSRLLPRLGVAPIECGGISRDEAVVQAYIADPLVYRGKITARLGSELIVQMNDLLPPRLSEITLPTLIIHGTEDRLANPEGSRLAYQRIGSSDKTLRLYPDLYHETMNEPEGAQVMEDISLWLKCHT